MAVRRGFYDDAKVYDVLHAPGTASEVTGLERIARRFVRTRTREPVWLEPACGTGRYLRRAAARGLLVMGFDALEHMVAYAARRLASAGYGAKSHLFCADMAAFADRCRWRADFSFNLINTIRHLPDDERMLAHFAEMAAVLRPGGAYAVGLSTTGYGWEQPVEDVWSGARGRMRVTQVVNYVPPSEPGDRTERVYSHLSVERPRDVEHLDSTYTLRTYSVREWLDLIARSPFALEQVVGETGRDAEAPESGYAVYVLRAG